MKVGDWATRNHAVKIWRKVEIIEISNDVYNYGLFRKIKCTPLTNRNSTDVTWFDEASLTLMTDEEKAEVLLDGI